MIETRHARAQIALLVLSVVSAAIAIYLTTVHYQEVPLVCSTEGFIDCARVTSSVYSLVPGTTIPITVPGLLWSIVAGGLALASWRGWYDLRKLVVAEFIWTLLALLSVLYLVFVEIVLLHTICSWCTALHVTILAMFLISVVQLQRTGEEDDLEIDEEEPITAAHK